ncbi:MAG TPA: ABC transporter permease [Dehalococcoidales bacterium]
MRSYITRRAILIIPTLILVTIMTFLMVRFVPGNVIDMMISDNMVGDTPIEVIRENIEKSLGLDVPPHVQYLRWVGILPQPEENGGGFHGILQGDLGKSLWTKRVITTEILSRIPISMELGIISIITGMIVAFPIGIYSAIRQDTIGDYLGRSFAILCIAVPGFWIGTLVFVLPSIWWGWSPAVEYIPITKNFGANIVQFLIPGLIMGTASAGGTMRMTRTMMLEVLRQDYIKTAWSKGLRERSVIIRHAMKNAMIPVVTIIGGQIPTLIGGAVIMEQIFCLPGIGRYMLDALGARDYPIISGCNLMMASILLVVILLVDMSYAWLDPRIRYR